MEFRQLQQIAAVCRHGGFSGAARHLRISQPTLSKSIARLEDRLGVQLFDRTTGGAARPTVYGDFLSRRADALVRSVETLEKDFSQFRDGNSGYLRIGMGPAAREALLSGIVGGMAESFPNLNLRTGIDAGDRIVDAMVRGQYDVAFVYHEAAAAHGDLIRAKVFEDRFVAAVRPDHPVAGRGPLTAQELVRHKIAASYIVPSLRKWVGGLNREEKDNLRAFVTDVYDLIRTRVAATNFIGVAPSFVFQKCFDEGSLVEVPLAWGGLYECWMLATPDSWRSPVLRELLRVARQCSPGASRAATPGGETSDAVAQAFAAE
ncbi:MAG: LysR family transcriptional regulator [Phenylobacterium sp.]|nr:LysR family transcriptional regulator [Phenylobacterium sp.]